MIVLAEEDAPPRPGAVARPADNGGMLKKGRDQASGTLGFPRTRAETSTAAQKAPLDVVGLFAGIGGIELGLSAAGHSTSLLVECDPGACAVLRERIPHVKLYDDVRTLKALPRGTDLLAAGFPCQDLSQAGKTVGISGSRSGLVGEVFRLLQQRRVPWLLLENVPFMLQLGGGRAMDVIVAAVEDLGYNWAYRIVNSRAFGLPQRRERVIFLASQDKDPRHVLFADEEDEPEAEPNPLGRLACGFYWTEGIRGLGWAVNSVPTLKVGSTVGIPSPPGIVLPSGEVVKPDIRDAERMQGFEVDWTLPAESVTRAGHRWKLVGNAVTVHVARWIGERLRAPMRVGENVGGVPLKRNGGSWPRVAWNVGDGRFTGTMSTYPVSRPHAPLHDWLKFDPALLSVKATAGFLGRTKVSSLRFPPGFLETLVRHLHRMEARVAATKGVARV